MSDEEEEKRTQKKYDDGDDDDESIEDEDDDVNEEEDVYVGVPTKSSQPYDNFYARIGGDILATKEGDVVCEKCNGKCVEIACVSAPFGDLKERFIAVNLCKTCGTWQARRHQERKAPEEDATASAKKEDTIVQEEAPTASTWGAAAGWGEETDVVAETHGPTDAELEELFNQVKVSATASTAKPTASTATKKTKKKSSAASRAASKGLLLDFVSEVDEDDGGLAHEKALLEKYNREARDLGEETFDLSKTGGNKKKGKDLDDFFERIALEPKQRIRYSCGGVPLWPSKDMIPKSGPGKCEACGGRRSFEFQITPQAVLDIQRLMDTDADFSTVVVFTCEDSCDEGKREVCVFCPEI